MHGRKEGRLVGILAAVVLCTGSTGAWSQEFYVPIDPTDLNSQVVSMPVTAQTNRLVSYADDPTLADLLGRVEGLEATQGAAAAAAKKKATYGGRMYFDWATFDQDGTSIAQVLDNETRDGVATPNGDMLNGMEARALRFFMKGNAFNVIDYKLEVDFATSHVAAKDIYGQINELPLLGHVRVGHFKEPIGLEILTSSKFTTFMNRSLLDNLGDIGNRKPGIMAFDWNEAETVTWAAGAFTTLDSNTPVRFPGGSVFDDEGGTSIDGRVTWVPWYDEATQGRGVFHLGASASYRDIAPRVNGANHYTVSVRPEAHLGRIVATTAAFAAHTIDAYNLEAAFVYGPLSIQAEYLNMEVSRPGAADANFDGGYIYFSYFLTGEHRPYDRHYGRFLRVKPFENFFRVRAEDGNIYTGKGAWEVAYRYSTLDMVDVGSAVVGGNVEDHTFGVNWYLTPYTRVMFNYIRSQTSRHPVVAGRGDVNILMTRFQVDF